MSWNLWILKKDRKEIKIKIITNLIEGEEEEEEEEIDSNQTEELDLNGNKDKYNKGNNNSKYIILKTLQGQ